ncbi:hypothetical protein BDZ90DRAFT_274303 [Jaminaea rosea]|uniref:Uncharacterized protein n=1 Tax=Jaminaea rosea TaxID=1569628 RepID=A0A316UV75_9BASI|nr:hypothetical protein BDZ90DRAFT_274303 [Jaminaea rosea]PWN28688.1 hypothetical protein BDZ90DRAFT_274303 [Jaminaea rosea]
MQSCLSTTTSIIPSCLPVCCLNLPHASSPPTRHPVAYSIPSQLGSALRCGAVRGSATIPASYTTTAFERQARHTTPATRAPMPSGSASSLSPQAAARHSKQPDLASPSSLTPPSKSHAPRIRSRCAAPRRTGRSTELAGTSCQRPS